jgi:hypothetical protein
MGIRLKHHGKVVAACSIAKYIHQYMGTIENLKYQNLYNPKNGRLKVTITTRISNCLGSQKPQVKHQNRQGNNTWQPATKQDQPSIERQGN